MRSVLVNRTSIHERRRGVGIGKYSRRKTWLESILGGMAVFMKHLPYKIVALISLLGAFTLGMALESGAAFIKEQATKQANIEMLLTIPARDLCFINIMHGKDI